MKVFTHGINVNFHKSAREMFMEDLYTLLERRIKQFKLPFCGLVDLEAGKIMVLGSVVKLVRCDTKIGFLFAHDEKYFIDIKDVNYSHEAGFDIIEREREVIHYEVLYLTNINYDQEETLFIADKHGVSDPLACITKFWEQTSDVGRNVDFRINGCKIERG